jgi:GNAT superfamily N-acetyltransferase
MNPKIILRELTAQDSGMIEAAFTTQGWHKPASQYAHYWQESLAGRRLILLAEYDGQFAGYLTVVWESDYPPFGQAGIPEIVDLNVLVRFRRMKIGTALMDEAERRIAQRSSHAGLGVCLHSDYGPAQVLYARRGYVPDGRGVFQDGHYPRFGEQVRIDDDLCLHLTRQLR